MGIFVKSHVIFPASRGKNKYYNNSIFKNIKVIEYSNENDWKFVKVDIVFVWKIH